MKEWGLKKKVFSTTLDNAENHNSMQTILKGQLQMISGSGLLCDEEFMLVRCFAHILNIIVKASLELANDLLHNIIKSVKYVLKHLLKEKKLLHIIEASTTLYSKIHNPIFN